MVTFSGKERFRYCTENKGLLLFPTVEWKLQLKAHSIVGQLVLVCLLNYVRYTLLGVPTVELEWMRKIHQLGRCSDDTRACIRLLST